MAFINNDHIPRAAFGYTLEIFTKNCVIDAGDNDLVIF
jgi:hypothetical protein